MSAVTETEWRDLIASYEAAGVKSDEALAIAEADGPSVSGSEEEAVYDRCWAAFVAEEDRLLDVVAPNLEAVAYQLRVFAERFHQADLTQVATDGEDRPAGDILRRILAGIARAGGLQPAR